MNALRTTLLLASAITAAGLPAQVEDDRENDTPTGTYWNTGMSAAQVSSLTSQGWRLTDIQIENTNPYTFTVAMVPNSGAYGIGWWWYYGIDAAAVSANLSANSARLIDLEVVDNGSGSPRFTCIMVSNTGANAKSWGWLYNTNPTAIANLVAQGNRIVDLEQYTLGSTTYYACVVIRNTGADSRSWWYYYNISSATLSSYLTTNNARVYDLDRQGSNFNVVMIRQGAQKNWRYYGLTAQQVTDNLSQIGARAIDIERYSTVLGSRFNVVMINNSNALSTRISEILRAGTDGHSGVYLKRANGAVLGYINGDRPHEPASTLKTLHHLQAMRAVQLGTTTLTTNYTTYTAGGGNSCPGGMSSPVVESLESVLGAMMGASDNNRTRTITDNFGGFAGLNSRAAALGMTSTAVNHHIGCGTPPNATTLRDIAHLHEQVINGYLGAQRDKFYELMRNDYQTGGYAEGALYPVMVAEANAAGLSSTQLSVFEANYLMAFKKGGYGTGAGFFRCWGGYVRMPIYTNGVGITFREYMVGSFVAEATDETQAIDTAKAAAAEVLREELRSALDTFRTYVQGTFTAFGSPCAGTAGLPSHTASGTPELGQDVTYALATAPRSTPAVLYFGSSNTLWNSVPLPVDLGFLNAPGCAVRTNSVVALPLTTSIFGSTATTLRIPIAQNLLGTALYSQFVVYDPRANGLGLTTTRGMGTHIGGRQ